MQSGPLPEACAGYLGEYLGKIRSCVLRLSEEQIWWRPGPGTNSVGNLLLHLAGNLTQWVLSGLRGEPDRRRRSLEFAAARSESGAELLGRLEGVVGRCQTALRALAADDLSRAVSVQSYDTTGLGVMLHVVEHMSYHTGQIIYVTKQLLGERAEIEFYPQHRGE